jgi:hypothetical protein
MSQRRFRYQVGSRRAALAIAGSTAVRHPRGLAGWLVITSSDTCLTDAREVGVGQRLS